MSRSKHSLSHYHLTTANLGDLFPISCIPVLPGDTIGMHTNALVRVSPLQAPTMHQVDARIHHFFVANRTIWKETEAVPGWESFITGGEDGFNTDTIPTLTSDGVAGGLLDYLGIPNIVGIEINAMPIWAFNEIYNEFYRDQDLIVKRLPGDLTVPNCAWAKDYFSTARPWSAKGPQVSIPVGDSARISHDAVDNTGLSLFSTVNNAYKQMGTEFPPVVSASTQAGSEPLSLYADLTSATGADPIDVRTAWGLQRFMENAARFGSRYPEKMQQLGSTYKGLLDRPEFLGGGQAPVNFSEVLQTGPGSRTGDAYSVGDMYGHGISPMRTNKFARTIGEHGYIISCMSVRPASVYQDGIPREFLKQDREDFHDPYLELVGQQEVWENELFAKAGAVNTDIFGYSDKYQEYRGHRSHVSAEFRNVLDYWHLARKFTDVPILNEDFINCVPSKRIFQEQTQDSLWIMAHHKVAAHRNVVRNPTARLI